MRQFFEVKGRALIGTDAPVGNDVGANGSRGDPTNSLIHRSFGGRS
jgi:hypothetical protein